MRFAESLPDDQYRIEISGSGATALRNVAGDPFNDGSDLEVDFRLDLGAQVVAIVPQPITRNADGSLIQQRDQIVVYFNDDDLYEADAENELLYRLIYTSDSANTNDDLTFTPTSVAYDAALDRAVLTFSQNIEDLVPGAGSETFRLRVGTNEFVPGSPNVIRPTDEVGSSFGSAEDLGSLSTNDVGQIEWQSEIVSSAIDAQEFLLDFLGSNDEPGHRQLPEEISGGYDNHINPAFGADHTAGITTVLYNFRTDYGSDPQGNPLVNLITDPQKQRAQERWRCGASTSVPSFWSRPTRD